MSIIVYHTEGKSNIVTLNDTKRLLVGRSKKCDVSFPGDFRASKNHCEIYYFKDKKQFALKDLESKNGTILNGKPIVHDVLLSHGDKVTVGTSTFLFKNENETSHNLIQTKKVDKFAVKTAITNSENFDNDSTETCLIPRLDNIKKKDMVLRKNANFKIGDKIDKFVILEKISSFMQGDDYLVKQKNEGEFLLRIFNKPFEEYAPATKEFLKIMRNCIKIDEPQLQKYYDCGVFEGLCYFTAEYTPNAENLDDKIAISAPMQEIDALNILLKIGDALEKLKLLGSVFHGDLTPESILYDNGKIKIKDYGYANWMNRYIEPFITASSPWYLSSEQVLQKSVDWRTDLYSMGIILFQMISGFVPFHSDDVKELREMRINYQFPTPQDYNQNILTSELTLSIITKLTATESHERYVKWSDFFDAIKNGCRKLSYDTVSAAPILPKKGQKNVQNMFSNYFNG